MPGYISRGDHEALGGLFAYPDETTGHVPRPASVERAEREASDGTAADRAILILGTLHAYPDGLTWGELADRLNLHHGQVSGALSNLHKTGRVFMLREKRGKSHPYCHETFRVRYPESARYDDPAQTRSGRTRELERQILALLETNVRYGCLDSDPVLSQLVRQYIEHKEN
jgi:hypothetical protein